MRVEYVQWQNGASTCLELMRVKLNQLAMTERYENGGLVAMNSIESDFEEWWERWGESLIQSLGMIDNPKTLRDFGWRVWLNANMPLEAALMLAGYLDYEKDSWLGGK